MRTGGRRAELSGGRTRRPGPALDTDNSPLCVSGCAEENINLVRACGGVQPVYDSAMSTISERLGVTFREAFPAAADRASLEFVEVVDQPDAFGIVIRLIVWDVDEAAGVQSIRDVKEQQVHLRLPAYDDASLARLGTFVRALVQVASRALAYPEIDVCMPHDLMQFGALKLAKAHTEADFVRALSVKSRLGRYLPATPLLA